MPKKSLKPEVETKEEDKRELYSVDVLLGKKIVGITEVFAFSAGQAQMFARSAMDFKAHKAYKKSK